MSRTFRGVKRRRHPTDNPSWGRTQDAFSSEPIPIQLREIVHHPVCWKSIRHETAPLLSEVLCEFRGVGQLTDTVDERVQIVGSNEESRFTIDAHLGGPIAVIGNDGLSAGEGLGEDPG